MKNSNRITALAVSTLIAMSGMTVYAQEEKDYSDYVPGDKPATLFKSSSIDMVKGWYNQGNANIMQGNGYVTYTSTKPNSEWNYFRPVAVKPADSGFDFPTKDFEDGKTYVMQVTVRKENPDDKTPYFGMHYFTSNYGNPVGSNIYGKTGMEISSAEWTEFKDTITFPDNWSTKKPTATPFLYYGISRGSAAGSAVSVKWENNKSIYLAEEIPYSLEITAGIEHDTKQGEKFEVSVELLNQIGIKGKLDQSFNWYAVNADRTAEEPSITVTADKENTAQVQIGKNTDFGKYYIIAESKKNDSIRKGFEIEVKKAPLTDYKPGAGDNDLKLDALQNVVLDEKTTLKASAKIVDSEGNEGELKQNFDWYLLESKKIDKTDALKLAVSEDTKECEVVTDIYSQPGTYWLVAESKDYDGFVKSVQFKVEKPTAEECVKNAFNEADKDELSKNIEEYMTVLNVKVDVKANYENMAEIIVNGRSGMTEENLNEFLKKAAVVSTFDGADDLYTETGDFKNEKELNLKGLDSEGSTIYSLFEDEITTEGRMALQNAMKKKYTSIDEFDKTFLQEVVLKAIKYPTKSGTGVLETILTEENAKRVSLNLDEYSKLSDKSDASEYIMNNDYTWSGLQEALNNIGDTINENKENSGSTGGTSSSGGSGSSGSGSYGTSKPSITIAPSVTVGNTDDKDQTSQNTTIFSDVSESHWAYSDIYYLNKINVVSGVDKDKYDPEGKVTREQFVKMICEAFGFDISSGESEFIDGKKGAWYQGYIKTAVEKGIINGIGKNEFGIGKEISREDMAVIITRAMEENTSGEFLSDFTDSDSISEYAKSSVAYLNTIGIINGFDDGSFKPKEKCTRAQAAKIICSVLNLKGDK